MSSNLLLAGGNSLRDVDITSELSRRPTRTPNYEAENRGLVALAREMAESPRSILQKLADTALELCGADSAGISLLEEDHGNLIFRWHATAGDFVPYLGGTTPRNFSPCGVVLDRNATQLMIEPVRCFPYIAELSPHVAEVLLIPFYRGDAAIGTVWVVTHDKSKRFDAEDARVMTSLSRFASVAVATLSNLLAIEAADRDLRVARARLEAALAAASIATWTWDIVNDRVTADANLTRLFAVSPEEAADGGLEVLVRTIHPDERERIIAAMMRSVESATDFAAEFRVVQRDGSIRWVVAHGKVERDAMGRALLLSGAVVDVDDQKRVAENLKEDDQRKNEFLAMLAHELRNPLAAISNAVTLMRMTDVKEHIDCSVDTIQRQTKHLSRLVDDLLDVSRINLGKIELRRDVLDVTAILDGAAQIVRPLVEERAHTLELAIERGNLWVDVDPIRLEQVIVNLLHNAAKFSENGGAIELLAAHEGSEVVIRVNDAGIGISPERLSAMFELFMQGDRSSGRSEGGLGIGLTLVKKLVELQDGSITANSAGPGKGSEFVIRLPAVRRPAVAIAPAKEQDVDTKKARILVVDDNVDAARGMAKLLGLFGHVVVTADSGPQAIESRSFRPGVILLDLGLPGMDGYEVANRLRQLETCKDVMIIATSGYGQAEDRRKTKAAGFDHHLLKPVDFKLLKALLAEFAAHEVRLEHP